MSLPGYNVRWLTLCLIIVSIVVFLILDLTGNQPTIGTGFEEDTGLAQLDGHTAKRILDATIQIYMISLVEETDPGESGIRIVNGLGTLVKQNCETLIITHDHWWYIEDVKTVLFYNSSGKLLLQINAEEFLDMVKYRDHGTMILTAPKILESSAKHAVYRNRQEEKHAHLPVPVNLVDRKDVKIGDIVFVARQWPDHPNQVAFLASRIESIGMIQGIQVFRLKSLKGESIVRGDSGGGIWHQGRLIGNIWRTSTRTLPWVWRSKFSTQREIYLDESTAAQIPIPRSE